MLISKKRIAPMLLSIIFSFFIFTPSNFVNVHPVLSLKGEINFTPGYLPTSLLATRENISG
jgi:hypothetical protein